MGLDNTDIGREEFLLSEEFGKADLTKYVVPKNAKYDIAISIEVAEHIEEKCADEFVEKLC